MKEWLFETFFCMYLLEADSL